MGVQQLTDQGGVEKEDSLRGLLLLQQMRLAPQHHIEVCTCVLLALSVHVCVCVCVTGKKLSHQSELGDTQTHAYTHTPNHTQNCDRSWATCNSKWVKMKCRE